MNAAHDDDGKKNITAFINDSVLQKKAQQADNLLKDAKTYSAQGEYPFARYAYSKCAKVFGECLKLSQDTYGPKHNEFWQARIDYVIDLSESLPERDSRWDCD